MHQPVLYKEIIHALQPHRGGYYIDGTLGGGGHARGILQASQPDGQVLGLDVDPQAISLAEGLLEPFGNRAILIQASYTTLREQLFHLGWEAVDGVVLDLGVSSIQMDTGERGFSFQYDAPLDMRFDPGLPVTAADLVNSLPEDDLADIIYRYGEEHQSRRVARAIVQARPLYTTQQLARLVAGVSSGRRPGIHPATRTFQALRIAVNHELEALEDVLPQAVSALAPKGRLAVIAFHSLEDRIVKQYFRRDSRDCLCPPHQPICTCGHKAVLSEITRHPLRPSPAEVAENPRSRSARLRVAEKL
ncbi:MAG: 16S rRNA (cytosine(1402)-N(4))-methyltransferase [Chloroflexi bacterium RBG_16_52_11]|nr:MAG: 16S rRNA (cytosine(1402)-N(4))-methyltransferase [Chloroflexi bacterium RBG_16_52_11]